MRSRSIGLAFTPVGRVGGLPFMAHLEIHGGLLHAATVAYGADGRAGRDPLADLSQQTLIVCVQAHIAAAVIDNQQQS